MKIKINSKQILANHYSLEEKLLQIPSQRFLTYREELDRNLHICREINNKMLNFILPYNLLLQEFI